MENDQNFQHVRVRAYDMHFAYNKKAGEWTCALASWEKLSAAKTKRLAWNSGREPPSPT